MLYRTRSLVAAGLALSAAGAASAGPTTIGGLWCGAGALRDFTLEIAQQYQDVSARLIRRGKVREITGHVDGARVHVDPQRNHSMELLAQGNELRIIGASGVLALAKGQFFTRAAGGSCTH